MEEASCSHEHTAGRAFYTLYIVQSAMFNSLPFWFFEKKQTPKPQDFNSLCMSVSTLRLIPFNIGYLRHRHLLGLITGFSPVKAHFSSACKLLKRHVFFLLRFQAPKQLCRYIKQRGRKVSSRKQVNPFKVMLQCKCDWRFFF